jgi:hypothetical protein
LMLGAETLAQLELTPNSQVMALSAITRKKYFGRNLLMGMAKRNSLIIGIAAFFPVNPSRKLSSHVFA